MRSFAERSKANQQNASARSTSSGCTRSAQRHQTAVRNAEDSTAIESGGLRHDFSRIPAHAPARHVIQAKLMVNIPGDQYEQEADRVADHVMRMPSERPRKACACGGSCHASKAAPAQEHQLVQRKAVHLNHAGETATPARLHEVLRSPGHPLDAATRTYFEPRFGYSFNHVRVHTDDKAAASANSVGAKAYTVGDHIIFGAGRYAPSSAGGQRLLAHELTHVIQQGGQSSAAGEQVSRSPRQTGGLMLQRSADERSQQGAADRDSAGSRSLTECPETHVIADDVYKAIGEAWKQSGHGTSKPKEHAARIVLDKSGKRAFRLGEEAGNEGHIAIPPAEKGDTTLGSFHTHPYARAGAIGGSFSYGDVRTFVTEKQKVMYVGAGTCYFALIAQDTKKRDACRKVDFESRELEARSTARGSFSEVTTTATQAVIEGCGLCFYKTCRASDGMIPREARLVR